MHICVKKSGKKERINRNEILNGPLTVFFFVILRKKYLEKINAVPQLNKQVCFIIVIYLVINWTTHDVLYVFD